LQYWTLIGQQFGTTRPPASSASLASSSLTSAAAAVADAAAVIGYPAHEQLRMSISPTISHGAQQTSNAAMHLPHGRPTG